MSGSKIQKITIIEASKLAGRSINSLTKRVMRAFRKNGIINIPGLGYYAILKPGKSYELLKIKPDEKKSSVDVSEKLIEILGNMKEYVCEDCETVIEKAIENVRN